MRRLMWLAPGVVVGVLVVRTALRATQRSSRHGSATGAGGGLRGLADSIRDFGADVRSAMSEREAQLRASTGLDGTLGPVADASPPRPV